VVWGAAVTCRADVIAWYSAYVVVNAFQLVLVALSSRCGGRQMSLQPTCLVDVYTQMFRPLAVTRRQVIGLMSSAWIDDFAAGTPIILENSSAIGDRLSLLLAGR